MHKKLLYTLNSVKPKLDGENDADIIKKQENFLKDDLMARTTLLHNLKDNIIPLFEEFDTIRPINEPTHLTARLIPARLSSTRAQA